MTSHLHTNAACLAGKRVLCKSEVIDNSNLSISQTANSII